MNEGAEASREVDPTLRMAVLVMAIIGFIQGALVGLMLALLYVLW